MLLTLFRVKGVLHYGIAGNADPQLEIGDVTIPQYWAHTGLWNWQVSKSLPFGFFSKDRERLKPMSFSFASLSFQFIF